MILILRKLSVRADIQKSLASDRTNQPRSIQWLTEAEAWAMEDTPDQVIAALNSSADERS